MAVRRSAGDARESTKGHWDLPGLTVSTPRSVLTLTLDERRMVSMKVPMSHGRVPRYERFRDWEYESDVRNEMAKRNSAALGGFNTANLGQLMLLTETYDLLAVRDYMLLWAGDPDSPLTAGYPRRPRQGTCAVRRRHFALVG